MNISIHALLAESDWAKSTPEEAKRYFYPRSPCGERQPSSTRKLTNLMISIHALLAESDQLYVNGPTIAVIFLSTLSLRRATMNKRLIEFGKLNFYPRSPCGERQASNRTERPKRHISIHALLAESDRQQPAGEKQRTYFYPRSPCGERRSGHR